MVLGRKGLFIEKQGDDTKKGNKGLKLLKTIFTELLLNRTGRRNKKRTNPNSVILFALMGFESFCEDTKQSEKCLR